MVPAVPVVAVGRLIEGGTTSWAQVPCRAKPEREPQAQVQVQPWLSTLPRLPHNLAEHGSFLHFSTCASTRRASPLQARTHLSINPSMASNLLHSENTVVVVCGVKLLPH